MSLMAINRTAKKYGTLVGAVMAVLMIGGVVISGLGGNLGGMPQRNIPGVGTNEAPIATVGDRKITKTELDRYADNLMKRDAQNPMAMGRQPGPEQMDSYRLKAIETLKQQAALLQIAKKAGIAISDADIRAKRDEEWNKTLRPQLAQQLGLSADADDGKVATALAKAQPGATIDRIKEMYLSDETLRLQSTVEKLSNQYKTQIAADDAAIKKSLSDMTVRHILVKFGAGALPEEQAKAKAEKLLAAVKADPKGMGALAKANTDDTGSKASSGVYEWKPSDRASIVPEFAAALDTLKPGETYPELVRVSNPGYSGFHIIRLEAVKPGKEFPKDYDKNKATYTDTYVKERVDRRIQQAIEAAEPEIPVKLDDASLQAEQDIMDAGKATSEAERNKKLEDAVTKLSTVKKEDDPLGIASVKKAQIYSALKKNKEAIAAYQAALEERSTPEVRLALAQAYLTDKQTDKVKEQLAALSDGPIPDATMQGQIASLYKEIGDTAKAKEAEAKAKEMQNQQIQAMMKQFQEQQAAQQKNAPKANAPASPAAPKAK